jgi:hypothetical protein
VVALVVFLFLILSIFLQAGGSSHADPVDVVKMGEVINRGRLSGRGRGRPVFQALNTYEPSARNAASFVLRSDGES